MGAIPYAINLIPQKLSLDILDAHRDAYIILRSVRIKPVTPGV